MIIFALLRKSRWLEIAKLILLIAFPSKCFTLSFEKFNCVFSYFEFKIRLIGLGLSFQKQKILVFELTAY